MLSSQEGNVYVSLMHKSASNEAHPWLFLGILLKTFIVISYEVKSKSDLTSFCSYPVLILVQHCDTSKCSQLQT